MINITSLSYMTITIPIMPTPTAANTPLLHSHLFPIAPPVKGTAAPVPVAPVPAPALVLPFTPNPFMIAGPNPSVPDVVAVGSGSTDVLDPTTSAVVPLFACSATVVGEPPLVPEMVIGDPGARVWLEMT